MNEEKKRSEYVLGFDRTVVPGEEIRVVSKKPQAIFKIERIIIPHDIGVDFEVLDVKIGDRSQLRATDDQQGPIGVTSWANVVAIPAVVFSETASGVKLKTDTVGLDDEICITVRNLNPAQRDFTCAVLGPMEPSATTSAPSPQKTRTARKPSRAPHVLHPSMPGLDELDDLNDDPSSEPREQKKSAWEMLGGRLLRIVDKSLGLFETAVGIVADRLEELDADETKDLPPQLVREYVLGFDTTEIPPDVIKRPQVIFRPERVVIPSEIGKSFMVFDIKVGKNSQFIASGEVPGITFSEQAFGVRLKMDTCQISMDVSLIVRNITKEPKNFTAAIIGPAIDEVWPPMLKSRRGKPADNLIYS